jgi:hypothetical protein
MLVENCILNGYEIRLKPKENSLQNLWFGV